MYIVQFQLSPFVIEWHKMDHLQVKVFPELNKLWKLHCIKCDAIMEVVMLSN